MCIIVAKKRDVKLPSIDTLEICFDRNSDGAGFMYTDNGRVVIDKGYMTFKSFKKHYNKLCEKYNNFNNKSLVLHFRIGTAGGNTPENTHPYPIEGANVKKTYCLSNLGIAHNGVINDYNPPYGDTSGFNDTQLFIKNYLEDLYHGYKDFYKNANIVKGLEYLTNSKLAFLTDKDEIYTTDNFIEDENGLLFSNSTYKKIEYTTPKSTIWDDDYYTNKTFSRFWAGKLAEDEEKTEQLTIDYDIADSCIPLESGDVLQFASGNVQTIGEANKYYYDYVDGDVYNRDGELLWSDVVVYDKDGEFI